MDAPRSASDMPSAVETGVAGPPRGEGLRDHPYRLLFPLGVALSWAGIAHWLLHALGYLADFRPVFHVIVQIQGFMTALAAGFLLTMIPRRTGSAPPGAVVLALAAGCPVVVAVAAWYGRWAVAEGAWLVLAAALGSFAVRRFAGGAGAGRRPPAGFLWIPAGLAMGSAGSLLLIAFPAGAVAGALAHELGRGLLLQGLFTSLILGVGTLALPLMTRGEAPADLAGGAGAAAALLGHGAAAALLALSFWIGAASSAAAGLLLRCAVVTGVLVASHRLYLPPRRPGWNARLIWLAAWMVPAGYLLAGLFPGELRAGLHVTFIGGFALLGLTIGAHVTLSHTGRAAIAQGRPWEVPLMGALMASALVFRGLMELDPRRYFLWMALAAASFLLATLAWLLLVTRRR